MKFLLGLLLCLFSTVSNALTPESGWWWNESESGRGFSIELQNNTIFMSGFLYDSAGAPFWFVTSAPYSQTTNQFEGDMLSLRGGQCITCTYKPAILQPTVGRIKILFSSPSTATITWPGGTLPITRQIYGVSSGIDRLFGTFAFSVVTGTLHNGQWITFNQTMQDPSLGTIAIGKTESNRTVVAAFNAEKTLVLVLVDSSTSYYQSYVIPTTFFGSREGTALWTIYLKTQTPPTPNTFAYFSKVFSPSPQPSIAPQTATPKSATAKSEDLSNLINEFKKINAMTGQAELNQAIELLSNK